MSATEKQSIKTAAVFQNALINEEDSDNTSTQASLAEAQAEIDAQQKSDKEAKAKALKEEQARLAEQEKNIKPSVSKEVKEAEQFKQQTFDMREEGY